MPQCEISSRSHAAVICMWKRSVCGYGLLRCSAVLTVGRKSSGYRRLLLLSSWSFQHCSRTLMPFHFVNEGANDKPNTQVSENTISHAGKWVCPISVCIHRPRTFRLWPGNEAENSPIYSGAPQAHMPTPSSMCVSAKGFRLVWITYIASINPAHYSGSRYRRFLNAALGFVRSTLVMVSSTIGCKQCRHRRWWTL